MMADAGNPEPVKYVVAALWPAPSHEALARLTDAIGPIDFDGPDHAFDLTDYYEAEMGPNLSRRLIGFACLRSPEELARAKRTCIAIEDALKGPAGRRVNLDVGYLDHNKLVLASIKPAGQKIYLRDGIYADLIARYAHGRYLPFEWTFPDFKDGRYDQDLGDLRAIYLRQIKAWRGQS